MPETQAEYTATMSSEEQDSVRAVLQSNLVRRTIFYCVEPFIRLVHAVAGWGVVFKIRLLLFFCVIFPALVSLVLLESYPDELRILLAVVLVAAIMLFAPLSGALSYLLIRKELMDIEKFCMHLKQGDYTANFELPHESDDEHELNALKRNLNWMAHVISRRVSRLHAALEGAHEDRIRYESLSNIDPLTNLANRRRFETRLAELAHEAAITKRPLSLMFIDCDKFKSVNDTLGHQAGDELLQYLAATIRRSVREYIDLPFRYGGDEFGVVCVGMNAEQAAEAAERIREGFLELQDTEVTLSIGVAGYAPHSRRFAPKSVAELVQTADKAAYQAKALGGNRVIVAPENSSS
ncbi:MAG: diguanylate cyclase [Oceanidesulfovibrio sp.]